MQSYDLLLNIDFINKVVIKRLIFVRIFLIKNPKMLKIPIISNNSYILHSYRKSPYIACNQNEILPIFSLNLLKMMFQMTISLLQRIACFKMPCVPTLRGESSSLFCFLQVDHFNKSFAPTGNSYCAHFPPENGKPRATFGSSQPKCVHKSIHSGPGCLLGRM